MATATPSSESGTHDAADTPESSPTKRNRAAARGTRKSFGEKAILSLLPILASLGAGAGIFFFLANLKEEPPRRTVAERSYNVETFKVESRTLREIVAGFGTAAADRQVTLSAEVGGLVTEVHPQLEVGVTVKPPTAVGGGQQPSGLLPGDELLRIDQSSYKKRIDALDRQIAQLKVQRKQLGIEEENNERLLVTQEANLKSAEEELASARQLRASGAGNASLVRSNEQQVNQYQAEVVRLKNAIGLIPSRIEAADAQIAAAQADLENANLDLKRTKIVPPFEGVLSDVSVEQGQYVRPGDRLMVLTDLNRIEVPVALTQSQFARIEPLLEQGEKPAVELAENETAAPRWTGRLTRVSPVANEVTRTVDVYVEVDNNEQPTPLLPGTFVHVRIAGPPMPDTMVIPRDVIRQGTVFVVKKRTPTDVDNTQLNETEDSDTATADNPKPVSPPGDLFEAEQVTIRIERNLQSFSVVESGLSVGDEVVMTNLDIVHDGALLVPQSEVTIVEELAREEIPVLKVVVQ